MIRVVLASALVSFLSLHAAMAEQALASINKPSGSTFVLPINDGYGVADCLAEGGECAITVANAWCAAQGYHHASDMRAIDPEQASARGAAIAVTCDP